MADARVDSTPSKRDLGRAFPAGRFLRLRGRRFFFFDPAVGVPEPSFMVLLREIGLNNRAYRETTRFANRVDLLID
jgi:hypothetical protein